MALRDKIEDMIEKMFAKQMEKFLQKTGTSLTDAKVPVVGSDSNGNPLFNTSSIGSADLAKLSGANALDGTIADAISGLTLKTVDFTRTSDGYGNLSVFEDLPENSILIDISIESPSYLAWMLCRVIVENSSKHYIRVYKNTSGASPYVGTVSGTIYYLSNS